MCVHYYGPSQDMLKDFEGGRKFFSAPFRDIFPGKTAPVYFFEDGRRKLGELIWGFPVDWTEKPVFNTRLESGLEGKKMWREAFEKRRILLPTLGFYEPHSSLMVPSPKTGRLIKQQYLFNQGSKLFFMAAIYEEDYFSLITTPPNSVVAKVHDRMPLVLNEDEIGLWLGGEGEYFLDRDGIELEASPKYPEPLIF
ncbi:MAG: SOS response-associated peptidase [Tissierellia bacterium]|nr:SOS response-associated peptidase [Tissierellia bacterium]